MSSIDLETAKLDSEAVDETYDWLRFGWRSAAKAVAQQVSAAGFRLRVSYEPDIFSSREELVRRIPHLRKVYNTFQPIRALIDRIVSAIAGSDPRIAVSGGSGLLREWVQRYTAVASVRQY